MYFTSLQMIYIAGHNMATLIKKKCKNLIFQSFDGLQLYIFFICKKSLLLMLVSFTAQ